MGWRAPQGKVSKQAQAPAWSWWSGCQAAMKMDGHALDRAWRMQLWRREREGERDAGTGKRRVLVLLLFVMAANLESKTEARRGDGRLLMRWKEALELEKVQGLLFFRRCQCTTWLAGRQHAHQKKKHFFFSPLSLSLFGRLPAGRQRRKKLPTGA